MGGGGAAVNPGWSFFSQDPDPGNRVISTSERICVFGKSEKDNFMMVVFFAGPPTKIMTSASRAHVPLDRQCSRSHVASARRNAFADRPTNRQRNRRKAAPM